MKPLKPFVKKRRAIIIIIIIIIIIKGHAVGQSDEPLRYDSEGRGFDSR